MFFIFVVRDLLEKYWYYY